MKWLDNGHHSGRNIVQFISAKYQYNAKYQCTYMQGRKKISARPNILSIYLILAKVSDEHIWAGQINHEAIYWHISAGQITKRQYIEIFADIWHWVWQGEAEPGIFNVAESLKSQLLVPRSLLGLGGQCVASVCKSEADLEFLPKMSWCLPSGISSAYQLTHSELKAFKLT